MSTHLDSGAFPALGTRADKSARKTPAPWDLPRAASESMLGAPLVTVRRDPPRTARASSANLRVVPEASGPHVAAADARPLVSRGAWWAFEAGLIAAAAVAVFVL